MVFRIQYYCTFKQFKLSSLTGECQQVIQPVWTLETKQHYSK